MDDRASGSDVLGRRDMCAVVCGVSPVPPGAAMWNTPSA